MPYDKDGKYYRKPVFNENFKGLKKKPFKKEYKQIKVNLKLIYAGLGALVFFGAMVGIADINAQNQKNNRAKRICSIYKSFHLQGDYNQCLRKQGFNGSYQKL